jgi:hypothetical protein
MALSKEDIKEGYYWVRDKHGSFAVVNVKFDAGEYEVWLHGWDMPQTVAHVLKWSDFIPRIEPPEGM